MKLLLSTICIALLGLFAYQVMSFPLDSQKLNLENDLSRNLNFDLPQLAVLNSLDEYSEMIQRPLFVKNLLPARGAQSFNEIVTANELEHLILIGIASSTDVQLGIVVNSKEKEIERLKAGQKYRDWDVVKIANDHIVFQNEDLEYKLFITPFEKNNDRRQTSSTTHASLGPSEIKSTYKAWARDTRSKQNKTNKRKKVAGSIYKYKKKSDQDEVEKKPVRKSPIRIPNDEAKDVYYNKALDEETVDNARGSSTQEVSADDFYADDEEITEDELKVLETLGAKIFDN